MSESKQDIMRFPPSKITDVAKALSGDLRVRILEALGDTQLSVTQLAEALGVAQPTVSINIQILEQAGLVVTAQGSNREKLCSVSCRSILLELPSRPGDGLHKTEEIRMPIGMYSLCSVQPPCGMANRDGLIIGSTDDPRAFYMPERTDAALLWFSGAGYVEYRFPNPMPPGVSIDELRLRAELCSEAPSFRMDYPSDITVFVNDLPIGTWTSPGDFGDRKGKLTPDRWTSGTEYGVLTEWSVRADGSYVNGARAAATTLERLSLKYNQPIRLRFEIREDADNRRGINLFGSAFGDHPQDIVLSFIRFKEHQEGKES
ncbi:ArsR family transcriptional regulator [Paenibacillus antri]|uniref:ArsR family transcriptional regulator n=1 Tax=Paenibacillus antri TaxID=2582848 RepID=A0A5R9G1S1_9BACL|nr:helix-turn-helix domain-containing protein [Paenibacillus antri]TLS48959.1 ArsR family transcriptional regulator [Paenibacillus antri]